MKKIKVPVKVEFDPVFGAIGYRIVVSVVAEYMYSEKSLAGCSNTLFLDRNGNKLRTEG